MAQAAAIRVIEQSHDRLLIYQPPYWPFAIGFFIAAGVIAVGFFWFFSFLSARPSIRFAGFVLALPFLFVGIKTALSQQYVDVSVPENTLTIRRLGMFGTDVRAIPLDDVAGVVQLRGRRATAVGIQLRSGKTVDLSGFTDQRGKNEMSVALEMFLATNRLRR